jgi:hypothetical protein
MTTPWTVTFDCADPARMAAFWKLALDYVDAPPPVGYASWADWQAAFGLSDEELAEGASIADPDGRRPRIGFLKVPEGKTAKNRLHLDVQVGGGRRAPAGEREARIEARKDLLVAAGATVRDRQEMDGRLDHYVLADPEGNELCVV